MLARTEILIDWLQLYCHRVQFTSPLFTFELKPFGTKHFSNICEVMESGVKIAEIAYKPRSFIIHKDSAIIKIENNILYSPNLEYILKKLISALGTTIKGITRVDFAVDFPTFLNNLKPNSFINKFLSNKYLKVGRGTFKVVGCQKRNNEYEYLRFGGNSSDVSAYIYNKSKELNAVKNKPWIRQNWTWYKDKQDSWQSFDTWRLEFSVKNDKLFFIDKSSGELVNINIDTILCKETRHFIFQSLLNHYFYFVCNNGSGNKYRMRNARLLDLDNNPGTVIIPNEKNESGRMQKIFIRMLEDFNNENRNKSKELQQAGNLTLETYLSKYDLSEWKNFKLKNKVL